MVQSWDLQSSCKSPVGEAAPSLSELCCWTVVPLYEPLYEQADVACVVCH